MSRVTSLAAVMEFPSHLAQGFQAVDEAPLSGSGPALTRPVLKKVREVQLRPAAVAAVAAVEAGADRGATTTTRTSRATVAAAAPSERTDRDLVDRARAGDTGAFGELVRRHQRRLHRLALHMLRDRAEAEDVTQETFVRAYNALARFDGRSEPYTWLYRIAVNLSLNAIRARKSARRASGPASDDPRLEGVTHEAQARAQSVEPADAGKRQLYVALAHAIDELSETLRTTLILVCVDGRSHEDAAEILGAPEGTIAWRVHEARKKLRESLGARGFDLADAFRESGGVP